MVVQVSTVHTARVQVRVLCEDPAVLIRVLNEIQSLFGGTMTEPAANVKGDVGWRAYLIFSVKEEPDR